MSEFPLHPFGDEIWLIDGPVVSVAGFLYPTRSCVIRLADGGLWVWSPVAISDRLRAAVDALGPVRAIIVPNRNHHLFLLPWKRLSQSQGLWTAGFHPDWRGQNRRTTAIRCALEVGQ